MRREYSKNILFISPMASLNGATILLLNLLRCLQASAGLSFELLLGAGGALKEDFESLCQVLAFYQEPPKQRLTRLVWRIFLSSLRKIYLWRLKKYFKKQRIELVYANTIITGEMLDFLSFLSCPVICHVHELQSVIDLFGAKNLEWAKKHTDKYIAASEGVKNNLISRHDINESSVEKVNSFVQASQIKPRLTKKQVCEEIDIPEDAFIVCMSAAFLEWRKAPDIFILLARDVNKRISSPVYFLYIGREAAGKQMAELMYDVRKLKLAHLVRFIGEKPNPYDYFAACDLFALVSREDPFPLVCLEAASLGKPIVCFDSAGIKEFVEDDCGFVIPYLNTEAMAEKIIELMRNPLLRQQMGRRAQEKVERYYDVEIQAPKILSLIRRTMQSD